MKPARQGPGSAKPRARTPAPQQPSKSPPAQTVCRRCHTPGPVGDDGFCERCEKALEQACL